ncbi:S1 domain-containing RNA-binding protein [Alteribacillus bidgolensis]|uniref:S1 RNA binding domain protein n=1 Tax=Alteribacillus bidgolensis TaxID=930129 RepID=A0A1G8PVW8_9BACI|nr:S1 domain-containing RNA-binding protein [Alteribacillus bidgolensis]SDI95980.1 S1 RNA binding domain protein [Alteribacillus bidgolensis]
MSIEVGSKLQGKVTGITHFGAFIELPDGKTGLVHISEVADKYVDDINQFLSVGDEVTVKVMKVEDDGKIGLSIRKAQERPKGDRPRGGDRPKGDRSRGDRRSGSGKGQRSLSFEEKMNRFMKDSEERLASLRKQTDSKRGGRSKK